jgi:hypothetical protein
MMSNRNRDRGTLCLNNQAEPEAMANERLLLAQNPT